MTKPKSWMTELEQDGLLQRFPPESHQKVQKGKLTLTAVQASDVIERLHNVFGHGCFRVVGDLTVGELAGPYLLNASDVKFKKAEPRMGPKSFVRYQGIASILDAAGQERFSFSVSGLRELETSSGMTWEDTAKSTKTNAICKAVFENLLVAVDVFKGYYEWEGDELVVHDPEEEQKAKKAEEAKIQRMRFYKEMLEWGKANREAMLGLIQGFKDKTKLTFSKLEELDTVAMSRIYFDYQILRGELEQDGKTEGK